MGNSQSGQIVNVMKGCPGIMGTGTAACAGKTRTYFIALFSFAALFLHIAVAVVMLFDIKALRYRTKDGKKYFDDKTNASIFGVSSVASVIMSLFSLYFMRNVFGTTWEALAVFVSRKRFTNKASMDTTKFTSCSSRKTAELCAKDFLDLGKGLQYKCKANYLDKGTVREYTSCMLDNSVKPIQFDPKAYSRYTKVPCSLRKTKEHCLTGKNIKRCNWSTGGYFSSGEGKCGRPVGASLWESLSNIFSGKFNLRGIDWEYCDICDDKSNTCSLAGRGWISAIFFVCISIVMIIIGLNFYSTKNYVSNDDEAWENFGLAFIIVGSFMFLFVFVILFFTIACPAGSDLFEKGR